MNKCICLPWATAICKTATGGGWWLLEQGVGQHPDGVGDKLVDGKVLHSDGGNAASIHWWYASRGVLVRDDQCKVMSLPEDMVKCILTLA